MQRSVAEVTALQDAFNEMLDRVEQERRTSGRRALDAQERERRRLARELHDELGQTLTGIVLLLDGLAREAPSPLQPSVEQVQEASRGAVEKTRDIARGLRPVALDEFGLRSALTTLAAGCRGAQRAARPQRAGRRPARRSRPSTTSRSTARRRSR